mgnify:CR=1 FL=1
MCIRDSFSGIVNARFGFDNVGFHMGAESVTIDFNADIPWEELLEIEAAANRYIYEDHAIDIQLHRGAELDAIDYRSKKPLEGDVRIVTFPGADCCACCGTHVMRSGQVGIVKFLSVQKFREGVRIELLCGGRAYRYLSACWAQDVAAAQALSVKPTAAAAAIYVPASIWSGMTLYVPPCRRSTPWIRIESVPAPRMSAPMELRKLARSTMCGSRAAFSITVRPRASVAAMMMFIVAPTETLSRYTFAPCRRPSGVSA